MENLIELLQNNKELRKQARQLIALAVGEMAEKRNNVSFDGWFNKNVREAKTSDESAALPLHDVSVNEGSEFLSVGVAVCPHFNECINNGKNEYCDLQTFQEIDCFVGQTER